MTNPKVKCPVCLKPFKRRQDVYAHYRHEMSGWELTRDKAVPHAVWAEQHGIVVEEGGLISDLDTLKHLKQVLYSWLSEG